MIFYKLRKTSRKQKGKNNMPRILRISKEALNDEIYKLNKNITNVKNIPLIISNTNSDNKYTLNLTALNNNKIISTYLKQNDVTFCPPDEPTGRYVPDIYFIIQLEVLIKMLPVAYLKYITIMYDKSIVGLQSTDCFGYMNYDSIEIMTERLDNPNNATNKILQKWIKLDVPRIVPPHYEIKEKK